MRLSVSPVDPAPVVDVFVQMGPGDFGSVVRCAASVRQQLGKNGGRVVIVGAELPAASRQQLESSGCCFLHEKQVFGFDANAISGSPEARHWLFNHFLKWELRQFSQTATYLVIDADQVLPQPISLWAGDRQTLFCENRFRFGYLMCFNYFFGQIPYPASPAISEIQHFNCGVVEEMIQKIQAKYKLPWPQATFEILRQVRGTAFNAGQNYGHYLNLFRPGSFDVQSLAAGPEGRAFSSGESRPYGHAAKRENDKTGIVRMSTLGHNGRFANQLFQYAFLRSYARREGLRAECPPWIGCSLFGHQVSQGENELPVYREDKGETDAMIRFDPQQHYRDFEIWGYFQDSKFWSQNPEEFRELFQPLPAIKKPLDNAITRLRGHGQTLVAIHLRRGDFDGGPTFWPAPEAWYLRWLEAIWPTLSHPVLYVATDDPQAVLPHFASYSPRSTGDLQITVNGAEFYSDFYVLSQCDVLGISNSTFSFAAAMMNTRAKDFARPDPVARAIVPFDPWNAPVQLRKPPKIVNLLAA